MKYWLLDRVPMWFRRRWPLRRFYWQRDEMGHIAGEVERWRKLFQ